MACKHLKYLYSQASLHPLDPMSTSLPSLAVVYLNRCQTISERLARECFIKSYLRFRPIVHHHLYIVNKGFEAEELPAQYQFFQPLSCTFIDINDEGFDLSAYRKAALEIDAPIIFFMNTYSEPLHPRWLDIAYETFTSDKHVGLVGLSANLETHFPFWPGFPKYPNYHIRTNGFMITKQTYIEVYDNRIMESKLHAYQFEAGVCSLTRTIQASGLHALVVGKKGAVSSRKLWRACIFRSGNQGNLMLADNQTRIYQHSSMLVKAGYWLRSYTLIAHFHPSERLTIRLQALTKCIRSRLRSLFR